MTDFTEIFKTIKELNVAYRKDYDHDVRKKLTDYENEVTHLFDPLFLMSPEEAIEQANEIKLKDIPLDKTQVMMYLGKEESDPATMTDVLVCGQYSVNIFKPYEYETFTVGYPARGYGLPFSATHWDEKSAVREMYAQHLYVNLDVLGLKDRGSVASLPGSVKIKFYDWTGILKRQQWNKRGKLAHSLKEQ